MEKTIDCKHASDAGFYHGPNFIKDHDKLSLNERDDRNAQILTDAILQIMECF